MARRVLVTVGMKTIEVSMLGKVYGGESFAQVGRAVRSLPDVPINQTRQQTIDFIDQHPFFHHGLMNLPIGGGKHFRNVPFVGPFRYVKGEIHGNRAEAARGVQVTKGTWAAH
jgi:hypothetical protein